MGVLSLKLTIVNFKLSSIIPSPSSPDFLARGVGEGVDWVVSRELLFFDHSHIKFIGCMTTGGCASFKRAFLV